MLQRSLPKGQNKTEGGGLLVFSARSLCSHACFTPDFLGELRLYSPLGCVDTGSLSVCLLFAQEWGLSARDKGLVRS